MAYYVGPKTRWSHGQPYIGLRYPGLTHDDRFHCSRKRGRSKKRYINKIEEDCNEIDLNMVKATRLYQLPLIETDTDVPYR